MTALAHKNYEVSKDDSRSIESRAEFIEIMERFLSEENRFCIVVASRFKVQLSGILSALVESEIYQTHEMVGTSLLLQHCNGKAAIRWIDFANSTSSVCKDNGIEDGIRAIREAITELIHNHS